MHFLGVAWRVINSVQKLLFQFQEETSLALIQTDQLRAKMQFWWPNLEKV